MSETGSMVSSQRTVSSVRSHVGSRFFASSFPVFPFLLVLEPEYHYLFSYLGVVVQVVQMLAFVLNPHLPHGETLSAISRVVYASHLPFWDGVFVKMSFNAYAGFFVVGVVLIVWPVLAGLWFIVTGTPASREQRLVVALRATLHLITSVLFIPLLQGLLSQMVCVEGRLWSFPDVQCASSAGSTATFVVGIIALILLVSMTFLVETTLFMDDYFSQHPLARKQYVNSSLYTCWRVLSCILFHLFLSNATNVAPFASMYTWLPMYVFFSAGIMSLTYVFYLPFLRQLSNRIFSGAFLMTAAIGLMIFFSCEAALSPRKAVLMPMTGFAGMDIDGLVVVATAGVFFFLGWVLADFRVNSEMTRSLKQMTDGAAEYPSRFTCLFPKGLPEYDVAYRSCMEMCNDVADGAFKDSRVPVSLETPFLTHVYSFTDVEVATRFLSTTHRITGLYPTPEMLSLATQIYMKGMLRYPESVSVLLDFASMINAFTMKPSLALAQCERTNGMACSFPTRYRAYRLLTNLKISLRLRDTAYQSTCEDAKRAHKEILASLSHFWNKLLSQQTDRHQVLSTYSMIARKREDTNRMFVKALQHQTSDRDLLLKYADFLEQVMLQPDQADKLRALVVREIEEERRHRGQRTQAHQGQIRRRQALALKPGTAGEATRSVWGMRLDVQNTLKLFALLVILLLAVALIVVSAVGYRRRVSTLRCVHYSSVARNLRVIGDMVGIQYFSLNEKFANSGPRLHYLVSIAKDMLSIHNFLTFGIPKSLSGARGRFVGAPKTISVAFANANTSTLSVSSFLALGYDYAQFLQDVPGVIGRYAGSSGSSSDTSRAAREARAQLATARASLLDDYTRMWSRSGYNASVIACSEWYREERDAFTAVTAGLFGLGIVAIVFYAEVSVLTSPVEKLKNRILSLFGFIPRHRVQEIALQARQRVEAFEKTNGAAGDDEDDHSAFQEVGEDAPGVFAVSGGSGGDALGGSGGAPGVENENKGDSASPVHGSVLSFSLDSSPMKKKDGGGVVAKSGAGGDDDGGEEEYDDSHALLWGTDRVGSSGGGADNNRFLNRSGLGRRSSGEEGGGSDSAGFGGASLVVGGGAANAKAKARTRPLQALRLKEQCCVLFVALLLVAALIVAALSVPMLNSNRAQRRNFGMRSRMYSLTHSKALQAGFDLTCFFCSGDRWVYEDYLGGVADLESNLPFTLGYNPADSEMPLLRGAAEAISQIRKFRRANDAFAASLSGTVSQYDPVTHTVATNDAGEAARATLFVSRGPLNEDPVEFDSTMQSVMSTLEEVGEKVIALTATEAQDATVKRLTVSLIVLSAVGLLGLAGMTLMIHFRHDPIFLRRTRCGWVLLIIAALAAVTTLVLAALTLHRLHVMETLRQEQVGIAGDHRRTVKSYLWPVVLVGQILQQGEHTRLLSVLQYFDYVHDDTLWRSFANQELGLEAGTAMRMYSQRMFAFQMIALKLLTSASGVSAFELKNVEWDFAAEPDAMETRLKYVDPLGLRYTSTSVDLARSPIEKVMMARDVMSNKRARDVLASVNRICDSHFVERLRSTLSRMATTNAELDQFIFASIATAATAVFITAIFVLLFLSQHTRRRREQLGVSRESFGSSFATARVWVALFVMALFFAAIFAVNMVDLLSMPERATQMDYMNARALHVTEGMIAAEEYSLGQISDVGVVERYRRNWEEIGKLNGLLTSGSTNVHGTSRPLDTLLAGTNVTLSPAFRYGFDPTITSAAAQANNTDGYTFKYGVDSAVASWMHRTIEFADAIQMGSTTQKTALLQTLRGAVMPLLRGLDEAAHLFLEAVEMRTRVYFTASVVLSAVLIALVVAFFAFLAVPVARQQVVEETGYRMLVRLIPSEIRESIPAVREFMNSDAADGGSSARAAALAASAGGRASGVLGDLGLRTFDELATPVIAINEKGCVIKFNRQAEEVFGYAAAEVLGNNVSLLMPERIARRHDSYLANYASLRKPGNRRVFQSREMVAKRKDGTLCHVRLTIHEMKRGTADRAFIGFVEDISAEFKARQEEALCRHIQEEVVVPMIVIDSLGTVLRFNRAAEECFGRSASEVLDQNVKMLMPEDIAARHDGYLATYLRTKERQVIGRTTRTRAVRKNGEEFPIELKIKEIVHDNASTYVGFCRDLSVDAPLEEAVQINQVIFEASVIPVICTDMQGRVILYSRSAERVFGYTAEEVISNNCKMLMPDFVADHHDGYMDRYRASWSKRNAPIMSREVVAQHKDGHLIPLLASFHEVKSTSTSSTALIGFFRELSEERSLERALMIDDVIAEHHRIPLVVINSQGIINRVNKATLLEFGYHHEEDLLHKNIKMLMPDDVAARHDGYINRYMLTGIGSIIEASQESSVLAPGRRLTAKRADGTTFPVELRLREVRRTRGADRALSAGATDGHARDAHREDEGEDSGGGGEEVFFIGFIRNVSGEVRLERQLAASKAAMQSSPEALCLLDASGRIAEVNSAAARTFRSARADLLGRAFLSLLSAPAGSPPASGPDNGASTGTPAADPLVALLGTSGARVLHTPGGEAVPVNVAVRPVAGLGAGVGSHSNAAAQILSPSLPFAVPHEEDGAGEHATGGTAPQAYMVSLHDNSDHGAIALHAARIAQIVELSPAPLVRFNKEGHVVDMNAAAEKQLGYSREEMRGKHVHLILPDPLALADMLLTNACEDGGGGRDEADVWGERHVSSGTDATVGGWPPGRRQSQSQWGSVGGEGSPWAPQLRGSQLGLETHQKRVKTAMQTNDGRTIPIELCVAEVTTQESAEATANIFIAYMYDQSGCVQLEAARKGCQAYAEMSPHPMVVVGAEGTITMCNTAACRDFHYDSPAQLVGQNVAILAADIGGHESDGFLQAFHGGDQAARVGRSTVVQCRRADGTVFPASIAVREVPLGEGDETAREAERHQSGAVASTAESRHSRPNSPCGKDAALVIRFVDRSEDGAIRCVSSFIDTFLQLSRDAAVLFFADSGELQRVSQGTLSMLGYTSAKEVVGQPVGALMPDFTLPSQAQSKTTAGMTSLPRKRAVTVRRRDGSCFRAELHVRQVSVGDVRSFVACLVDGREREDYHACRNMNLALVEHSPIPVLLMDSSGAIQTFSPAAEAFFGYSAGELIADESADVLLLLPEMTEDRAVVEQLSQRRPGDAHGDSRSDNIGRDDESDSLASESNSDEADAGLQRLLLAATAATASAIAARGRGDRSPLPPGRSAELHSTAGDRETTTVSRGGTLRGRYARLRHGTLVPVDVTVTQLPSGSGSDEAQFAVFIVDRSVDNAEAVAQQLSDAVARTTPLPSLVVSEAGIILEANQHMARFTQYRVEELEGQLVSITAPHKSLLCAPASSSQQRSSTNADTTVYVRRNVPVLAKDGTTRLTDAHVCVLPSRGTTGTTSRAGSSAPSRPRVFFVTFVDHSATTDLHRAVQRLETLFHSAATPVMQLDAATLRVVGFNPAASRLLGLAPLGVSGSGGGGPRQKSPPVATATTARDKGEERDSVLLGDLLADPHAMKHIKRFLSREPTGSAASPPNSTGTNKTPSLRLTTTMRTSTGDEEQDDLRSGGKDSDENPRGLAGGLATITGVDAAAEHIRAGGQHVGPDSSNRRSRRLDVELLLELVGDQVLLYVRDVAAKRRHALHDSLLAAMQSTLREAFMVVSDDDVVVSLNDAATRLLGYELPPGGTLSAHRLVDGGIAKMYAEVPRSPEQHSDHREGSFLRGAEDVVIASLELADACQLAPHNGGNAVMRPVAVTPPATATERADASRQGSGLVLPVGADDNARLLVGSGSIGSPVPPCGRTIRTEVRSRRRQVSNVPCRCRDGRIVVLDLQLCEVQVPLAGRPADASAPTGVAGVPDQSVAEAAVALPLRREEDGAAFARSYVVFLRTAPAPQQLESSILLGEAVLAKSPTPIVATDLHNTVVQFNAAAERLFRFRRQHVLGKDVSLLLPRERSLRHEDDLEPRRKIGETHVMTAPRRVVVERRDGEQVLIDLSTLEVLNDHGQPYLLIGFLRAVEEQALAVGEQSLS